LTSEGVEAKQTITLEIAKATNDNLDVSTNVSNRHSKKHLAERPHSRASMNESISQRIYKEDDTREYESIGASSHHAMLKESILKRNKRARQAS
jgi:hypothetical protein